MVDECRGTCMGYEMRLQKLGLTTLEIRRERADLIEVFKRVREGGEMREEGGFVQRRVGLTRGHRYKLFKKRFLMDVGRFSFGNRVCNAWNSLPDSVVEAKTLNVFKNLLDHYLRKYRGLK